MRATKKTKNAALKCFTSAVLGSTLGLVIVSLFNVLQYSYYMDQLTTAQKKLQADPRMIDVTKARKLKQLLMEREAPELHWMRVVPEARMRFFPERIRLVLADDVCSTACSNERRCSAPPGVLPLILAELIAEFKMVLGSCLASNKRWEDLGFWVIDDQLFMTPMLAAKAGTPGANDAAVGVDHNSRVLSEALRQSLSAANSGNDPVLLFRAVSRASLEASFKQLKANPDRQEMPLVSVCVGSSLMEDNGREKFTVYVGSDDCGFQAWSHVTSFDALRRPRSPRDRAVCIGTRDELNTVRIAWGSNCSGVDLGVRWRHTNVFYVGSKQSTDDEDMCVRYIQEEGKWQQFSRWLIMPKSNGSCGSQSDGFQEDFAFKSLENKYSLARIHLCAAVDAHGHLRLLLGCNTPEEEGEGDPLIAKAERFAVLNAEGVWASTLLNPVSSSRELFCIAHNEKAGDVILQQSNCTTKLDGISWHHADAFIVPSNASGGPWCLARCPTPASNGSSATKAFFRFRTAPYSSCTDLEPGCKHMFSFREVQLEEMTEQHGLLTIDSAL